MISIPNLVHKIVRTSLWPRSPRKRPALGRWPHDHVTARSAKPTGQRCEPVGRAAAIAGAIGATVQPHTTSSARSPALSNKPSETNTSGGTSFEGLGTGLNKGGAEQVHLDEEEFKMICTELSPDVVELARWAFPSVRSIRLAWWSTGRGVA